MRRRVYIFVNGILCRPGDSNNWNVRAVNWIHRNTDDRAVMLEYFCRPIGRAFFQKSRAEKLADLIEEYAGWEIILVGHSNGTDLILNAMALMDWPRIEAVHLVSAACEKDFEKNNLNWALAADRIGHVGVWIGGQDSALRFAQLKIAHWLGYGTLGLHGPAHLMPSESLKVTTRVWKARDHSDCFQPYCFGETMRGFLLEQPADLAK